MYDCIIIGGGIVGLSTALKIKENRPHWRIALLEKESCLMQHQTGNNSGVIHSGIYYKPGSLKAKNCIEGYEKLLKFCDTHQIPYELCGKLIVAVTSEDLPRLETLYERGIQNGLTEIKKIPSSGIAEYEPYVKGLAALYVPYTGIINFFQLGMKFASLYQDNYSGEIYTSAKVVQINNSDGFSELITPAGKFKTKFYINTTGLHSDRIARLTLPDLDIQIIPFRGEYYTLCDSSRHWVNNLVYPVPDPAFPFLGVHFTRRITGKIEAGPNAVFAFHREGYTKFKISLADSWEAINWPGFRKIIRKYWKTGWKETVRSFSKQAFTNSLRSLVPGINPRDLEPGGAGVRAQACSINGELIDDFCIREDKNAIHVLNAPSPAATASIAIGEYIAALALKKIS